MSGFANASRFIVGGYCRLSDAIKAILDSVTTRLLSYRPKDKGQQSKKIERRVKLQSKNEEDCDDRELHK